MADVDDEPPDTAGTTLAVRPKKQRQQLTKGMEHMRAYVTVPSSPQATPPSEQLGEDAYGVPAIYSPVRKPPNIADTVQDNPQKRSDPFQFGTRYLTSDSDIFSHNAWDHVEIDPQYNHFIASQTQFQRENQVSEFDKKRFNGQPEKWWDRFYSNNSANFFKDRRWLVQEFPTLGSVTEAGYGPVTVLEVGAGAGNTAFPLLERNENPELRLWAVDYSRKAVEVIKSQKAYVEQTQPQVLVAEVWDVASSTLPPGLTPASVDIVVMIFIFSALSPDQWSTAVSNIDTLLKPGGEVLFRDYGRGDLAQVRFKKDRYLDENFYVRGDGTRVYFFEEEELRQIWSGDRFGNAGDISGQENEEEERGGGEVPRFEIVDLATDRRMLVNRQRKLKMYRCWMQGRFRKADGVNEGHEEIAGTAEKG